ncbi:hypothetical protein ABN763_02665 [Spongiivirga sp. MCCC 1A20706]|uniref:hypothetical protein n=1 Tax=Spongiivirga sp. MCCC 1A20706 TaxID=3160963 RepID=UPI0039779E49
MKTLQHITLVAFLCIQAMVFGQTENAEANANQEKAKTTIETEKFKDAIGTFLLVEGDFELQIVQKEEKMYIITEFSNDILIQKNDSTLCEPTRGVDLSLIAGNTNGLHYSQNGYETILKRVEEKK